MHGRAANGFVVGFVERVVQQQRDLPVGIDLESSPQREYGVTALGGCNGSAIDVGAVEGVYSIGALRIEIPADRPATQRSG